VLGRRGFLRSSSSHNRVASACQCSAALRQCLASARQLSASTRIRLNELFLAWCCDKTATATAITWPCAGEAGALKAQRCKCVRAFLNLLASGPIGVSMCP
jgi:hypothetical protein